MASKLFLLSLADIFSIYPRIFREIIAAEELKRSREGALPKDFLYLPSDAEWQERVYYRLLEVQKRINVAIESGLLVNIYLFYNWWTMLRISIYLFSKWIYFLVFGA